jgi:uncharacterized protein YlxP (DUF503 family)
VGSETGFVAVLVIELHFPEAGSLKAKRRELASTKALLQTRFGAAVAETGFQDLWQRGRLLASLTAGTQAQLAERVDHLCGWLDARHPSGVRVERMTASVEDLLNLMSGQELWG